MRWLLGALVAFGFAMLGIAAAQSAEGDVEAVRARGWVHTDANFARLVFDWATPVGYTAAIEDGRLVVTFERPAQFSLTRALGLLAPYVGAVDPASTDRRLVFSLSAPFRMRHFTDGPKVAIDLFLPQPASGAQTAPMPAATPLPAPTAAATEATTGSGLPLAKPVPVQPAAEQVAAVPAPAAAGAAAPEGPPPIVRLRVGEHPGFSRLVFDWPSNVSYRVTQNGDSATVSFDAPGRLMLDGATKRMPVIIRDFVAGTDEAHPSLTFHLAPGTRIKDFRDGTHVVLDLSKDGVSPAAVASSAADPVPASAPPLNLLPEIATPEPAAAVQHHPVRPSTLPANTRTAADLLAEAEPKPVSTPSAPSPPATTPAAPAPAADAPAPEAPTADPQAAEAAPTPADNAPAGETTVAMATPATAPLVSPEGTAPLDVPIQVSENPEGFTLRFAWPAPARLALFRRAGALWVIFDRPARFDLNPLETLPREKIGKAEPVAGGPSAALRLLGTDGLGVSASLEGNQWLIDFGARAEAPSSPLAVVQYVDPVATGATSQPTPRVQLRPTSPGPALAFVDPEVGDQLVVVPSASPGEGVAAAAVWPGFRLIPTVQGIAIEPRGDGVEIAADEQGITIGVASALGPSRPDGAAAPDEADPRTVSAVDRLFDLPAWRHESEGTPDEVEATLTRAITDTADDMRDLPRVELARFYFAQGRPAEAGALVDMVMHDRQSAQRDPELLLISAASNLLLGRADVARQQLENPVLRAEVEAEPWRGALAAAAGQWDAAASDFVAAPTLLEDQAPAIRAQLGMLAAEAAIRTLDTVGAAEWLDRLKKDSPSAAGVDRLLYLDGLLAQVEGRDKEARDAWEKAAQSTDPETRARAEFALIDLLTADGSMEPAAAIEKLEHARYAWRDDGLEFRMKHLLGQLYVKNGQARVGLGLMRQIAADFPENPETPAVVEEMGGVFRGFFATDGTTSIKPFEALALYDEFPELVPAGPEGDAIQQGLAERFLEMDLPERAATLLEDQVRHRLQGAEKARVGTRLAQIHMVDDKPEAAIRALAESESGSIPPELARERQFIEADALFRLGRIPDALAKLAASSDPAAAKLQVRIHWQGKQWPEAAKAIAALLTDAKPESLSAEQAEYLQNLAVALTLADDRNALAELRQKFAAGMAETPNAAAFQLLTTDLDPADAGDLAGQLAGVATLDAFLTDYRKRFMAPAASPAEGAEPVATAAPAETAAAPAP